MARRIYILDYDNMGYLQELLCTHSPYCKKRCDKYRMRTTTPRWVSCKYDRKTLLVRQDSREEEEEEEEDR